MRRIAIALGLAAFVAAPLGAQNLTGSYVYQTQQGPVTLELQHSGTQVTGVMHGLDGSTNRLDGTFDGRMATGTVHTNSGSGWFAAGELDGGLTLIIAELDPATGEPDVNNGWRLDFTRTGGAGSSAAVAPAPSAGGQVAPSAGARTAPQPSQSTPLVQEWMGHLRGKKVTYMDSYSSGSSGGYNTTWEAFLCSDGSFHFRSSNSMNADVGGVWGSTNSNNSFSGTWRIVEQYGQAILQYQRAEYAGTEQGQWIALEYRNGQTLFDGTRVFVTSDNDMCR